jgi:iron complex outermembrane receptor protein
VLTLKARAQFAFGDLHGNVGIQAVHQKQTVDRAADQLHRDAAIDDRAVTEGASYWDILPSLNAYYDLRRRSPPSLRRRQGHGPAAHGRDARQPDAGLQQPMPRRRRASPGQTVESLVGQRRQSETRTVAREGVDLSYEWYIGPASYIAVAGFYKKLDSYIYTQRAAVRFQRFPLPSTTAENIPPGVIISRSGRSRMPANGNGGNICGYRAQRRARASADHQILEGFGVLGSYLQDEAPSARSSPA